MTPMDGVRVTVIAREVHTPYSGMLPGYVAGHYQWSEIHIDLGPLCRFAGARLITGEVSRLDLDAKLVHCGDRPPFRYDFLSINSGAVPEEIGEDGVAVKPIGRFLPAWHELQASAKPGTRILFVGGGAGGVELALAVRQALGPKVTVGLIATSLLPSHSNSVRRRLAAHLARVNIEVVEADVVGSAPGRVNLADGTSRSWDHLYWVTGVAAPLWLAESGLATDPKGFVKVDATLRSVSRPEVFAVGDVAHLVDQERPKSGVFAVRSGPPLSINVRRAIFGLGLKRFKAQSRFLSLIGTGDGSAVASHSAFTAEGRWVWRWKEWIDRRFMAQFTNLPSMLDDAATLPAALADTTVFDPMRCGGCGAKFGADPLRRVLDRLPPQDFADVMQGIGDDAAVLRSGGAPLVLTTDGFRSLVDDPYLFGRITAHHSLNDIFAMGAQPTSAMALATVPLMAENMMEDELYQLLRGAVDVLNEEGVPLVGGHSSEGPELSLGLAVTGNLVEPLLAKGALCVGDHLILTKALGVGVLMAANMRGAVPSYQVQPVLDGMDQSNRSALEVFRAHDVHAATDITGFGLAGHLSEMLRASGLGAEIRLGGIPEYAGAVDSLTGGVASVLQGSNERALGDFEVLGCAPNDPRVRLLADPQTSGGLLGAFPESRVADCLAALVEAGYPHSRDVAVVTRDTWRIVA